ncbi:hypothetical protein L6452_16294 [Arctium lappa]|uniref:Uncharacterized protein n=1 Tax=Arctium lappa TaxID=4217 RepID=A0ACB9C093_ARCLA|nr:hypothetical protein L6452_16294 [Arctium lappa]
MSLEVRRRLLRLLHLTSIDLEQRLRSSATTTSISSLLQDISNRLGKFPNLRPGIRFGKQSSVYDPPTLLVSHILCVTQYSKSIHRSVS